MKGGGEHGLDVRGGVSPAEASGTTVAGHLCPVLRLAGVTKTHGVPGGTIVECECGKRWKVTKKHVNFQGRRGAICGCGWALIE